MKLFPENAGQMAVAGAAGSVIYMIASRQRPKNWAASIVVGAITAMYLGPAITPVLAQAFGTTSEIPGNLGGYICGMMGLSMNLLILDVLRGRLLALKGGDPKTGEPDEQK